MKQKKKVKAAAAAPTVLKRRQWPDWQYAQPDERNMLIEEAREIVYAYLYCRNKDASDYKLMDRAARRWLKETKA